MSLLDQFRGGEKVPGAFNKHSQPGATVHGEVVDVTVGQAREYMTDGSMGELLYFADGKPKLQYVVTIKNPDLAGKISDDDDGRRRIYIKTWYKSDRAALLAAVDAAGDDDVHVGGQFAAQFLGKGKDENGREAAWNVYKYEYRKPSGLAAAGLLDQTPGADKGAPGATVAGQSHQAAVLPEPATVASQPALPPAEDPAEIAARVLAARQQAAKPAGPAPLDPATAQAVRSLISHGLTDDEIRASFPAVDAVVLAALRNVVTAGA